MNISFEKWHGNLNDFVIFWVTDDDIIIDSIRRQSIKLCMRDGSSIGADGIVILVKDNDRNNLLPIRMEIINSDGSQAKTCGNGIRCAALSVLKRHYLHTNKIDIPDGISIRLSESVADCRFISKEDLNKKMLRWPLVNVSMGSPIINKNHELYSSVTSFVDEASSDLKLPELKNDWSFVEFANQHLVFFLRNKTRVQLQRVGTYFQKSKLWDGINVHLVTSETSSEDDIRRAGQTVGQINEEKFDALVWERGVGETAACGSGACAIAVAALDQGFLDRDKAVQINMPGGHLYVEQNHSSENVNLSGSASLVFEGQITI